MSPKDASPAPRDESAFPLEDLRELDIEWAVPVLPLWSGELRVQD